MQPVFHEAAQLAHRLQQLRIQWKRLTQEKLASAFSAEDTLSAATVSSWENRNTPKLPPADRLEAYARFFATHRSVETPEPRLLQLGELTPEEMVTYKELMGELTALRNKIVQANHGNRDIPPARSWHFNSGTLVTIICAELPLEQRGPLANPSDPNRTELHGYADADALVELFGHIRSENPQLQVQFKTPSTAHPNDLTGHLVILGGVIWNEISERLSRMAKLPVTQVKDPPLDSGEIFVSEENGERVEYWPQWTEDNLLSADVGLLARVPNPLSSSHTLTICNGIHSRGVYGAVRTLTHINLRNSNERYISANFGNATSYAILMTVEVIKNQAMTPDFNSDGIVLYKWSSSQA